MNYPSPLEMLYKWSREKPREIYLSQPINRTHHTWDWNKVYYEVMKMSSYLGSLNLKEKSKIGILSKNCAHWIMCDLAIMQAGHISVPLYPNLNSESLSKILEHSEAEVLFIGKLDDFDSMKAGIPSNIKCITFPFYLQHLPYDTWNEVTKGSVSKIGSGTWKNFSREVRDRRDIATIIYTSGTTGEPKGVMHKFFNFSFATTHAVDTLKLDNETFFSYLPLSHIAERVLVQMGSLYTGGKVFFAESLDTFAEDLSKASPTVFLGVPRIWNKFQQGILSKFSQKKLDMLLKIPIISSVIKSKIKQKLGLSKAKQVFTGAAPTPESLLKWFSKIDIHIQEAYAMTENTCYSHVTLKENIKTGHVGQPLPFCQVKLSERNEILIKHDALMDGYYKNEAETKATIQNGWLHTGDEGKIDNEGFLKITGRVKDIFKTSKGKYIAPSPIEMKISINQNVEQVCVVGNGIPQPIALIVLSEKGRNSSKDFVAQQFKQMLVDLNPTLDKHENIKKVIVVADDWNIENKLLTPTMKIKRNSIEKVYVENYVDWYEDENTVKYIETSLIK